MLYRFKDTSDASLVVLDTSGAYKKEVRQALVDYKKRWGISVADKLAIATTIEDIPRGARIIMPEYQYDSLPSKAVPDINLIPAISLISHYDIRRVILEVKVTYTRDIEEAREWLNALPNIFTYDCETASLYTKEEQAKAEADLLLITEDSFEADIQRDELNNIINSNALDPFRNQLTMYSFGIDEKVSFVISNEDQAMEDMVLDFLTTTEKTVIVHNAGFDMKVIRHRTGKFIKNWEDSRQLTWVNLNHANTSLAKTGLKGLAGYVYKDWGVSDEYFGIEHKYDERLIHYAGIDASATFFVWNEAVIQATENP